LREGKKDQDDEERNGRFCRKGTQGPGWERKGKVHYGMNGGGKDET
jgi:hypothetical protein